MGRRAASLSGGFHGLSSILIAIYLTAFPLPAQFAVQAKALPLEVYGTAIRSLARNGPQRSLQACSNADNLDAHDGCIAKASSGDADSRHLEIADFPDSQAMLYSDDGRSLMDIAPASRGRLQPAVFEGPSLASFNIIDETSESYFERYLRSSNLDQEMQTFMKSHLGKGRLWERWNAQQSAQVIAHVEWINVDLKNTVTRLQHCQDLDDLKIVAYGAIKDLTKTGFDLCTSWQSLNNTCEAASRIGRLYYWMNLCASLRYAPLIRFLCLPESNTLQLIS